MELKQLLSELIVFLLEQSEHKISADIFKIANS